jgi:hypothetical protein
LPFPAYTAVTAWDPADRDDRAKPAVPEDSEAVPRVEAPSKKVTDPVAEAGPTVAVKVTTEPAVEGLREDPSVVVDVALFTVWDTGGDVLPS